MKKNLGIFALLFATACVSAEQKAPQPQSTHTPSAAEALHTLGVAFWDEVMKQNPTWATYLGNRSNDSRLPDISEAAQAERQQGLKLFFEELSAIDTEALIPQDKITWAVLDHEIRTRLDRTVCQKWRWKVDQLNGHQIRFAELPSYHTINNKRQGADLVKRYVALRKLFTDDIENLRAGAAKGWVAPKTSIERVLAQVENQLDKPAEKSPYMLAAERLPDTLTADERRALRTQLLEAVERSIYPALRQYHLFLRDELLPKVRKNVGLSSLPAGTACYQAEIRGYTGSTKSPEEIHLLGLKEVARIEGRMRTLLGKEGADLPSYFTKLQNRKDQFLETENELLRYNENLVAKAYTALPRLFGKLPKTPIKLKSIEDFRAPDAPAAYYYAAPQDNSRPAYYYVNTHKPASRPLYNMAALAFHEAVPGHHLQIALANENLQLPSFQRHLGQTAFVEGWALYAESLAGEVGLYESEEEKLGALNYEIWRAVRLVVDTGLHAKGWSREKALDYFLAHTAHTQEEAVNEIDRYITWPGQALAYKLGQLEILALRTEGESLLKDRFDLRAFHDEVLGYGAVPLPALRAHIRRWIASQQTPHAASAP